MAYKAILAGASGLIGSNLLQVLLQSANYDEVLVLVRQELPVRHKKLLQLVIDFEDLDKHTHAIKGHVLFSCLGTTRIQTPDKEEYRQIDYCYPLEFAKIALNNGVKQFHVVTAIGADKSSSTFYLKLKGELEHDLQKLGFESLHIYQPAMLIGERKRKHLLERVFSAIFPVIDPLLIGSLKKYRSIQGITVAKAMYKKSFDNTPGIFIHTSDKIKQI